MFHPSGSTAEGLVVRLPVAFSMRPITAFQLKVGGLSGSLSLDAYDPAGLLVDRTPISLSNPIQPYSVSGTNIAKVVLSGDEFTFCMADDLQFTREAGIENRPIPLQIRQHGDTIQISWPIYFKGALIQASAIDSSLDAWFPVAEAPIANELFWRVTLTPSETGRFFMLRQ